MAAGSPNQYTSHELRALPPSTQQTSPQVANRTVLGSSFSSSNGDSAVLIKGRHGWALVDGWRLENNLLWGAGFLELANAGDFAANIWNDVPVPLHAVILMAIGGTVAGIICIFAFTDSIKAWHNIQFLRRQRAELRVRKAQQLGGDDVQPSLSSLEVFYQLTNRELRTEVISRWSMDIFMGIGAVLISIGTFMAIGGANRTVWFVSNLLSGYLGNAPVALIGVINALWQIAVARKMLHHKRSAENSLKGQPTLTLIRKRCFNVQLYSIVNGTATVLGGVGSMITPTHWWGYVILIPVIISAFFCNFWWRRKLAYDRPNIDSTLEINPESLINEIRVACQIKQIIEDHPGAALPKLITEHQRLDELLAFFSCHGLFEIFCLMLANDESSFPLIASSKSTQLGLDKESLSALYLSNKAAFWQTAEDLLRTEGPRHFRHRRRFFIELLGEYLSYST